VALDGYQDAGTDLRYVASDLDDLAAHLVPHDERRMDAVLRPGIPPQDVQIGPADGGGANAQQDFVPVRSGHGPLLQL
jgi:hypothetical protein